MKEKAVFHTRALAMMGLLGAEPSHMAAQPHLTVSFPPSFNPLPFRKEEKRAPSLGHQTAYLQRAI